MNHTHKPINQMLAGWRIAATWIAATVSLQPLAAHAAQAAEGAPTAQVQVVKLRQGQISQETRALGSVRVERNRTMTITFPRAVEVSRVYVRAGEQVKRGQPLVAVRGAPGGKLAYAQARDAVRFAETEMARTRQLASEQLATRTQVDAAAKVLADAKSQLAAAEAQRLGDAATVSVAAHDAVVTAVQATAGAFLAAGGVALELAPATGREAVVGVSPEMARKLRPRDAMTVRTLLAGSQRATGTVRSVAGMVDSQSRLVDVVIALDPSAPAWIPGTPIEATFASNPWTGWVVPRQAVLRDASGQAYVFQDNHGKALRVNVALEIDTPTQSGIAGPLKPDLPLVVLGNYQLTDGMAVKAQ